MPTPAKLGQRIEFRQHLRRRLRPRHPPVQFDDVAEFAHEGAAAGELHGLIDIVRLLQQIETRDRRPGDLASKFRALEETPPLASAPRPDESTHNLLRLPKNPAVAARV